MCVCGAGVTLVGELQASLHIYITRRYIQAEGCSAAVQVLVQVPVRRRVCLVCVCFLRGAGGGGKQLPRVPRVPRALAVQGRGRFACATGLWAFAPSAGWCRG